MELLVYYLHRQCAADGVGRRAATAEGIWRRGTREEHDFAYSPDRRAVTQHPIGKVVRLDFESRSAIRVIH